MIEDFKTNELKDCCCGQKITSYSIGYGPTPYDIACKKCKKQTSFTAHEVTGPVQNLIDYWNNHCANMTIEELNKEVESFVKRQSKAYRDGATQYASYWYGKKNKIFKSY